MTLDIQSEIISRKCQLFIDALAEQIADNDAAIDGYNRAASLGGNEWQYTAPAWLSYYSSTGTGAPWQDKLTEQCENAQATEWSRQFPQRASLFDIACDDDSPHQHDAQEWLVAALHDEAIYLSLSAEMRDDSVTIRAGFTDEINRPLAMQYEHSCDAFDWLALDDAAIAAMINEIEALIYTESNT